MKKLKNSTLYHSLSDFIHTGPRFKDTESISQNRFTFLILLSVAMGFINYINADRAVQIQNGIYPKSSDENQNSHQIDFDWIEFWCNLPNCFFTPLILGYLSDFISIQYLLNFTSLVMLISTIFLYLYYCYGYAQIYVLSRIFFSISNEGLQNATFNLVYEYSNMYKCESKYFSLHSIFAYNIQRLLPYIFTLIYDESPSTKEAIYSNQPAFYSQYLIVNIISCLIMSFINKKNQIKERNEEQLDQSFLVARFAPQQKLSFFQALRYIIQYNTFFSIQCLIGGMALFFTSFYFQSNGLINAILKFQGSELYLDINFSTKGTNYFTLFKLNKQFNIQKVLHKYLPFYFFTLLEKEWMIMEKSLSFIYFGTALLDY